MKTKAQLAEQCNYRELQAECKKRGFKVGGRRKSELGENLPLSVLKRMARRDAAAAPAMKSPQPATPDRGPAAAPAEAGFSPAEAPAAPPAPTV